MRGTFFALINKSNTIIGFLQQCMNATEGVVSIYRMQFLIHNGTLKGSVCEK